MPRLLFLDWLRIGAFVLLVLYHVGMYYVSWDWHVKSAFASTALEPFMRLSSPWRMSLLFIVSGAATAALWARASQRGFMRQRSARLLLPLLAGMVLVVPPQAYFEVGQKMNYSGHYGDFLRLYFSGYGGFCRGKDCLTLPTWNHLWFLPYLWCYTLLLWGLLRRWPRWLQDTAEVLTRGLRGWRLLSYPVLWLALLRTTLLPQFGSTHALLDDWFNHATYFSTFMLGALLAHQPALFDRMAVLWRPALAGALACWLLLALFHHRVGAGPSHEALRQVQRCVWAAMQWWALVAVIGLARRFLDRDHPWRMPLAEAVFPVYVVHQTLIVCAAVALRPLGLRPLVEGPLLVALTFAASLGAWAAARRFGWLRPWLGLRPLLRPVQAGAVVLTRPGPAP